MKQSVMGQSRVPASEGDSIRRRSRSSSTPSCSSGTTTSVSSRLKSVPTLRVLKGQFYSIKKGRRIVHANPWTHRRRTRR